MHFGSGDLIPPDPSTPVRSQGAPSGVRWGSSFAISKINATASGQAFRSQASTNVRTQAIAFGGIVLRHYQILDFFEGSAVIALSLDRFDVHGFSLKRSAHRS